MFTARKLSKNIENVGLVELHPKQILNGIQKGQIIISV